MSNIQTASIDNTPIENTNVEKTNASVVLGVLVAQIAEIAEEVENLPLSGGDDDLSSSRIMAMQKIDLCSQRLRDISKVMQNLVGAADMSAICSVEDILDDIWLEHTQNAINESR